MTLGKELAEVLCSVERFAAAESSCEFRRAGSSTSTPCKSENRVDQQRFKWKPSEFSLATTFLVVIHSYI